MYIENLRIKSNVDLKYINEYKPTSHTRFKIYIKY